MRVYIENWDGKAYQDAWQAVKNAAMNTIGKETGKYPDRKWKKQILLAEHSPIRRMNLTVRIIDVPYFVAMHLVRHWNGVLPFISTQRTDRTGIDRRKLPQEEPVSCTFDINAQAFINISRKRLCGQADADTRYVWGAVLDAVRELEPELRGVCVPECVYRGFCPEMHSCGFCNTEKYREMLEEYRKVEE